MAVCQTELSALGLIGNCQFTALIERTGTIVWCCLPRFDSPPVFGSLLDPDAGSFVTGAADGAPGVQSYVSNTNVLDTVITTATGRFRIRDFAPRFEQHGRMFRPTMLIRQIEPLDGAPRIVVRCTATHGWSKTAAAAAAGSHHISFDGFSSNLRLTTDVPLAYLDGQPFTLTAPHSLVLTWGDPVDEAIAPMCERFAAATIDHWRHWVKQCDIPSTFQHEVIRSALALKLHCYEDTGAIIAACTTSIPESTGSGRTWDYRYCWMRDAYYVVDAFRLLGQFDERERFTNYLLNVAGAHDDLALAPLYTVSGTLPEDEYIATNWAGFNGDGPVRVGNAAMLHKQHDIFGELVLALSPVFFDERFSAERTPATLDLLLKLARRAASLAGTPDTGIWEFRLDPSAQTFSSLMCWAAADRAASVAARYRPPEEAALRAAATRIQEEVFARAWNPARQSLVGRYDGDNLDASLLQAVPLRFSSATDPRLQSTVDSIWKNLTHGGWLMRYSEDDGFGKPTVAFTICTFWLIEALATLGRITEARELMAAATTVLSPLGLMSEDYDTVSGKMMGNFPQAYSHVGFIRAAFAAAPPWRDVI